MKNPYLYNLMEDVKGLYLKTSNGSLEDQFIALSQAYQNELLKWLGKGKVTAQLQDSGVLNALYLLAQLRRKHPQQVTVPDVVEYFSKERQVESLSYIMSFANFLGDERVKSVIDPFKDIIVAVSRFSGGKEINLEGVLNDLISLQKDFSGYLEKQIDKPYADYGVSKQPRQTKRQKLTNMFSYLLRTFSEEIASAAERNGLEQFANGLRQGILAKAAPVGIERYMSFPKLSGDKWKIARKLANYVAENTDDRFRQYNHDLVEIALLNVAGQLTKEDFYRFKEKTEEAKDVSRFMAEEEELGEDQEKVDYGIEILDDNRLNPEYIYMLSIFLFALYQGVNPGSSIII